MLSENFGIISEGENCAWQFMFLHCQGVLNYKKFLQAVMSKSEVDLASLSLTASGGQKKREEEREKKLARLTR